MATSSPSVLALNVGAPRRRPWASGDVTGIDKRPVPEIEVRDPGPKEGGLGSGVVGDAIGDRRHHGGVTQAVYAYAREDHDWWQERLGRPLRNGMFGENVTTVGVDCTTARVGELWRIGAVVLRVEVPRIPCATFAGHLGERGWVRRFTDAGRTGAYLSVVVGGTLHTGDAIDVERPGHDVDLLTTFRAFTGDLEAAARVLDAGVLHETEHAALARTVGRRVR
ncbi:MAG TPA: MOSC domain-containing protein [Intrasporangium sp.]|uniref:MOSC domain-containing protein n=1 Tax=Intrasporangium sp. TaxID=1925024 RepID=UPI002D769A0A|nr:MOSC domain-containing protein [Intrasporangium sp.]HET7397749.1 MOSC domain-containing protein [Intrasporangium sp.]